MGDVDPFFEPMRSAPWLGVAAACPRVFDWRRQRERVGRASAGLDRGAGRPRGARTFGPTWRAASVSDAVLFRSARRLRLGVVVRERSSRWSASRQASGGASATRRRP